MVVIDRDSADENDTPSHLPAFNGEESASRRATREKLIQRHPELFEKSRALISLKNERFAKLDSSALISEDHAAKLEKRWTEIQYDMLQIKSENAALKSRVKELELEQKRLQFENEKQKELLLDAEKNFLSAQLDIEILKEQREAWQDNMLSSSDQSLRDCFKDRQLDSNLADSMRRLAQHVLQIQMQNSSLNEELRFEREQLRDLQGRWKELKAEMDQLQKNNNDSFTEPQLHRIQMQIELSNEQIQYLEALAATQAEIEAGHVELATELQAELDEKDAEISILYRMLRTLQKHMHRLYSEAQRSRELVRILQRENMDLLHAMQRLEDRQVELHNQSQEKSNRNVHLLRLLRQTQRAQIEHHLRQLECIQLEHRVKIAEMRIPSLLLPPDEAASTNALLFLHRVMFKSRLIIGHLDDKLSSSEITPEFHLSCICARLAVNLQSSAHHALVLLANVNLDYYFRFGLCSGDLLSCDLACDTLLHLLGDDMLMVDFDTSALRSANDTLTKIVLELVSYANDTQSFEHIMQASLNRVYFQLLEQNAVWEEFRNKIIKPQFCDDNVWRITVTTNLDNMFAAYNRALSASRVAFQEADGLTGLFLKHEHTLESLISELDNISDRSDDAVRSMNSKVEYAIDKSNTDEFIVLFREYHDDLIATFGRISQILSEIVTRVRNSPQLDYNYNIFHLRFATETNQTGIVVPWQQCAIDIKEQLEDIDKIRLETGKLRKLVLEAEGRIKDLGQELEVARLHNLALVEKVDVLKKRELQYQETIDTLKSVRNDHVSPNRLCSVPNITSVLDSDHNKFSKIDSSVLRLRRLTGKLRYRMNVTRCQCNSKLEDKVKRDLPELPSFSPSWGPDSEILPLSGNVLRLLSTPKLVLLRSDLENNLIRDQHYRQCLCARTDLKDATKGISVRNDILFWADQLQSQHCFEISTI